jgi:ADP-ribose pyrophosphatase YjhB (NUDIX family)
MTDAMVWFDKGNERFVLRVAGIAIHRNQVLLFSVVGWDWWALPGGRVEMLEKSEDTLKREMREELETEVEVGRLVWIVENFFKDGGRSYHEVGLHYSIILPDNASILSSSEYHCTDGPVKLRFRWFPLSELENVQIRPLFLKTALARIPEHTEHIVWYDESTK